MWAPSIADSRRSRNEILKNSDSETEAQDVEEAKTGSRESGEESKEGAEKRRKTRSQESRKTSCWGKKNAQGENGRQTGTKESRSGKKSCRTSSEGETKYTIKFYFFDYGLHSLLY